MGGMNYVDCDVPDGMTLIQWRRVHRRASASSGRRHWLMRFAPPRSWFG
jgi:hypothetical protein